MSNFKCEKCGTDILEGYGGRYVTSCQHYPLENMRAKPNVRDRAMTFPEFEKLIAAIKADSERTHALYRLGVDTISYEGHTIIENALGVAAFGKDGWEWIQWFIFERKDDGTAQAWDADGNPICQDVKGLWEYVTANK